jgi:hypothetical protein
MSKGGECIECGEGSQCDGGTIAPRSKKGYYGNPEKATGDTNVFGVAVLDAEMYECPENEYCLGDNECIEGMEGRMCSIIKDEYYVFSGSVNKCSGLGATKAEQVFGTLGAFVSILAVWYLVNTVFAAWFAGFGITMDSLQNIAILYSFSLNYNTNTLDSYGLRFLLDFALFDVEIFSLNCVSPVSCRSEGCFVKFRNKFHKTI